MRGYLKFIAFVSSIVSTSLLAGTMGNAVPNVLTLSAGPAWTSYNKTQIFFLQPDIQKTYAANHRTYTLATGELFYGWQRRVTSIFIGQLGLAGAFASNAILSGDIWEDADPDFNNYTYRYKVTQARFAIKGKLITDFDQWINPYGSASVGVARNRAHHFSITPRIFEEVPAPPFSSHSTTAFSYTLGLGVQKNINKRWLVGIGYEFADLGESKLSRAWGQTLGSGLQLSHLYINQLQLSVSYLG